MSQHPWEHRLDTFNPTQWERHIEALRTLPDKVHNVFCHGGILETHFGKPFRKGQYDMAMAVAHALSEGKHLAAEAGTGTGKTLAYGVPAAILGVEHPGVPEEEKEKEYDDGEYKRPRILPLQTAISVHTLSLQDQLERDFELISQITKVVTGREPQTLRVSGRENYFCEVSARRLAAEEPDSEAGLAAKHLLEEYERLKIEGKIKSGLTAELPSWASMKFEIKKDMVASEANCTQHQMEEHCSYNRVRDKIKDSHLLAINHNLLVVGWPDTWHIQIVDEAHTLEEVVMQSTSEETSTEKIERAVNRPGIGKTDPKGLNFQIPVSKNMALLNTVRDFELLIQQNKIQRVRGPLNEELQKKLDDYLAELPRYAVEGLTKLPGLPKEALNTGRIGRYLTGREPLPYLGSGKMGREGCRFLRNVKMAYNQIHILSMWTKGPKKEEPSKVYWTEKAAPDREAQHPTLKISEANPKAMLAHIHSLRRSILTSATLAGPGGLEAFVESQGLDMDACDLGEYPAPFNLQEKMKVVVPQNIPEPGRQEQEWKAALPQLVMDAIHATAKLPGGGGTMVLFTSKADMNAVARTIRPILEKIHQPLLIQDGTMEKRQMVEKMQTHGHSVLLGLDSFWTGVDIPGNALRHVVVARLPFQVPTPLNEARKELATAEGKNAFTAVDLRAAVGSLRQGTGRLIRTTTDDGIITILDPRVLTKSYGREFIRGLPKPTRSYTEEKRPPHPPKKSGTPQCPTASNENRHPYQLPTR